MYDGLSKSNDGSCKLKGSNHTNKIGSRVAGSTKGNPSFPDANSIQSRLEKVCQEYNGTINKAGRNDRTLASSAKNEKTVETGAASSKSHSSLPLLSE
jgi:hypothetical protein